MQRIRIVFVLLALVLLVPLALVVRTALSSIEAERTLRHRAAAERVIDEMERELTALIRREEDRPFGHYRYFFVPPGSPSQVLSLTRSPLSELPREPFIVCYFQIDPDGTVTSPLWPDNERLATSAGWQPTPEIASMVDLVKDAVRDFFGSPESETLAGAADSFDQGQDTGTTITLEPDRKTFSKVAGKRRQQKKEESSLSFLESLNRGASTRRQRPAKVEPSPAQNVYNFAQRDDNVLQRTIESQVSQDPRDADLVITTPEVEEAIEQALRIDASSTIDVRLEPMAGSLETPDHLVLHRAVSIGRQEYRQGLVLDVPSLVAWLSERVLSSDDLAAHATVTLATVTPATVTPAGQSAATRAGGYNFRHRFAEPFGAIAAEISIDPLPELLGTSSIYALSALLASAATFGLFALYRMVAVVVAYAQRRNNFVSAVTHELKTPLTAIRMYGEMLRDGVVASEDKRQRYYEIITAETERLTRLVNNVLELSQLEQKKRSMKMVVGDVAPVVEEALGVLGPHARKQGFTLRFDVEPDLPQVRFDRDALTQVLFNLVDNALKYSRTARQKEVVLSCRRAGDGVVLAVADRGPGVEKRHLKKIFEPFYRGEDELTRTAKGTGIGLALVRGLVERMGGTVSGRNGTGGGFEVDVFLAATG